MKKKQKKKEKIKENNNNKYYFLKQEIERWKNGNLNNYAILILLNLLSNRSFSDIYQYPIFPWTVTFSNSNKIKDEIRKLEKPMGEIFDDEIESSKRRLNLFEEAYESMKEELEGENEYYEKTKVPKIFYYNTNYSNPVYLCYYLIRIIPFSFLGIEFQGNNFDDPNRMFTNVSRSFINCLTQKSDVRELIPEFYYFPEFLINLNNINLGCYKNKEFVNDVKLPFDYEDPNKFILKLRTELESKEVSLTLNKWIDLIFGKYQKEGKIVKNLFRTESYLEFINENNCDEDYLIKSMEFGIIPKQIFKENFDEKQIDKINKIDIYNNINKYFHNQSILLDEFTLVVNLKYFIEEKYTTIIISTYFRIYFFQQFLEKDLKKTLISEAFCLSTKNSNEENINTKLLINLINLNYENILIRKKNLILFGGLKNAEIKSIILSNINHQQGCGRIDIKKTRLYNSNSIILNNFYQPNLIITAIEMINYNNNYINFIIIGDNFGNVKFISINITNNQEKNSKNDNVPKILVNIFDHSDEIIFIKYNFNLNLWLSAGKDGLINIYTPFYCKIVQSLCLNKEIELKFVDFSSNPFPSVVIYNSNEILIYSLNGNLLCEKKIGEIIDPKIIKNKFSFDEFVFVDDNNFLVICDLPFLNEMKQTVKFNNKIKKFDFNDDYSLIIGIEEGNNLIMETFNFK